MVEMARINSHLHTQQMQLKFVEEKFKSKREEIVGAMRKRRAMEILKEKDLEKHKNLLEKREIAALDEVSSTRRLLGL